MFNNQFEVDMASYAQNLNSIVETTTDYRSGELPPPTNAHVEGWLAQFPDAVREQLCSELAHVLSKTYISRKSTNDFLNGLLTNKKLCGTAPDDFWKNAKILDIQNAGHSQHEMLQMLNPLLKHQFGFGVSDCGKKPSRFIYIDDGLFTGNRILRDLKDWIIQSAPNDAKVEVIVIALHTGGQYYARTKLTEIATSAKKTVEFGWWRIIELEDQKRYTDSSDVLRVTRIPDDARTQAYVKTLKYPPLLRNPGNIGPAKIFSSEKGRDMLEQQMLLAGTLIRERCANLKPFQRPLGNSVLETLGFGSTFVTFRNCPNNSPLAFWAGNPWQPLFRRKTN
jgi:hypothetical protein